ncbi:MAG: aminopeptidase P family protein [Parachlamydiales bacterium]|nr:aminopeptidase P family protein [Verrucomicrobiota bacterium]MBX3718209.1 aminopeptidase P family protein [Candidatus Acheromyda pituitae]
MRSKKNSAVPINQASLSKRLQCLKRKLAAESVDVCLIDSPLDLLYYTGLKLSAGYLIVSRRSAALFVDGRYIQMAKEKAPMQVFLDGPGGFEGVLKKENAKKMAFDSSRVPYDQFIRLKKRGKPIGVQLIPDAQLFQGLRAIKDREEIEKMRQSAHLAYKGFLFIRGILKTGITEQEVARKFEIFCLEQGAEKLSFEPIIAFGKNSAMPHYRPQQVSLKPADIVLIDIGVVLDKYHSDMTRVLFFQKQDPFFKQVYEVVLGAQKAALEECVPGSAVETLDLAARKVMRKAKLEPHFLHSLGHGIGLETHEYPRLSSQGKDAKVHLKPGMAVTIEPGLYFQGRGGIRYEDTVVVTESGYENLYPEMDNSMLIVKSSRGK